MHYSVLLNPSGRKEFRVQFESIFNWKSFSSFLDINNMT